MAAESSGALAGRLVQLLDHLGVNRAHVAARSAQDWEGLARTYPERIASLTLVSPPSIDIEVLRPFGSRLLILTGDQGIFEKTVLREAAAIPDAKLVVHEGYFGPAWADVARDQLTSLQNAMPAFLAGLESGDETAAVSHPNGEGEHAGISYRVLGSGPPLLLMPLTLAPSQWEPLIPMLSRDFCTVTLGGPNLGFAALLEARGSAPGFTGMVRKWFDDINPRPGESILDVGCGSGVIDRWAARRTQGRNPITAVDINAYLLREAEAIVRKERLDAVIRFRHGDASDLDFPDGHFDVACSCTVMEELDADRMLAELIRVTKPGGRVAVIVRANDVPWWGHMDMPRDLKSKIESIRGLVEDNGCADAGLYRRFRDSGLKRLKLYPQLAEFQGDYWVEILHQRILPHLSGAEAEIWSRAVSDSVAQGAFFYALPHHCAVGTKP